MINTIGAILAGYMLGAFLPAYFLARWLKGFDIRTVSSGETKTDKRERLAGTTHAKRYLGWGPAVITALYDTAKGIFAIVIAQQIFQVSPAVAYLSGLAAIIGHIFPFYLGFRGGGGLATAVGILLFNIYRLHPLIRADYQLLIKDFLILLFIILVVLYVARKGDVLSLVLFPVFSYFLILRFPVTLEIYFMILISAFIFSSSLYNVLRFGYLRIDAGTYPDHRPWRLMIRPAAIAFPILSFYISKTTLITLVGSVLAVFLIADLVRLTPSKISTALQSDKMEAVFKKKEKTKLSSMTLFLLGCFMAFLFFEQEIAVLAVSFLIFGDIASKLFGIKYGRTKLFSKTLEGSICHFAACVLAAYLVNIHLGGSLIIMLCGAAAASIAEVLPFGLDDNVTVPLLSGLIMVLIPVLSGSA